MDPVKNFGFVTVSTGYDASAISIILSSGHGLLLPDPVVDGAYDLVWYDDTLYPNPASGHNITTEIVRVTGPPGTGDTKTIVRAQQGTNSSIKNVADSTYKMILGATAKTITDIQDLTFPTDQIEVSTIGTPTYDDMQDFMNLKSSGIIAGGIISDSGAGQIDVSAGKGIIKMSDTVMSETKSFDWSLTENIVLTDALVSYVYIDYNAGSPIVAVTTDRTTIEQYRQFTLGRVCRFDGTVKIINSGTQITDHDRETHERLIHRGIQHAEGAVVSETGTRNIASTAGILYLGNNQLPTISQDTSGTDLMTRWYHSGGTWTSSTNAQIDNTYYDDGTDLAELTVNRYGVHWIFICGCGGDLKSVYGQGNYTLTQAENASVPSSLPDCIDKLAILAAKVIIQKSASSFISIVSAYDTQFPVSSPSNHNDLGGIQGGAVDDYYHLTSAQHGIIGDPTGRSSSLTIASNDSSATSKAQADYVCDGVDDQVQIQAAIDTFNATGGDIYLTNGVFNISSVINVTVPITWHGCGPGEHWAGSAPYGYYGSIISADAGFTGKMFYISGLHYGGGFFDMGFSGYNMNQSILIPNMAIDVVNAGDFMVHHCFIFSLPFESAIRIDNHGSWIDSCDFEYNRLVTYGAVHITNYRNWVTNCYFSTNRSAIEVDSKWQNVHNCVFTNSKRYHIACATPTEQKVTGCTFETWNSDDGGYAAIRFYNSPLYNHIVNNTFDATGCNGSEAIDDNGTALDYCIFNNNIFYDFGATSPFDLSSSGTHNTVRNNIGYITENSGTATLVNGNTSIAVTHGLDATPVAGDIIVTPIEAWGSMAQFYIDTYTSTQFTIHSNADPGQDVDFAWKGIIL